jgi:hypothetical protein
MTMHETALNVRPFPQALREALRQRAKAEGEELYRYVLKLLQAHVAQAQRDPDTRQTSA